MSYDDKMQRLQELREAAIYEENTAKSTSFRAGLEQGLAKGKSEGKIDGIAEGVANGERKKQLEIAKKMKKEELEIELISKMTELSIEEINKLYPYISIISITSSWHSIQLKFLVYILKFYICYNGDKI